MLNDTIFIKTVDFINLENVNIKCNMNNDFFMCEDNWNYLKEGQHCHRYKYTITQEKVDKWKKEVGL